MDIQNKTITITGLEQKAGQYGTIHKVKDQDNKAYLVYETKQDGSETVAYSKLKTCKIGSNIEIGYKEEQKEYQGKPYTARTIINIKPATSIPQSTAINNQVRAKVEQKNDDEKWEKISYGKCKHAYLVEAFKKVFNEPAKYNLNAIEQEAEAWADMSMRKLPTANIEQPPTEEPSYEMPPF